ncbi:peptide chain release factor N(5)-glutamine methyltransferase [soil metagenome]
MVSAAGARARALARIAPLDADVLLAYVLGAGREQLYAHPEAEVPDELLKAYEELVARRAAGEPVAYLRGFKEFYGLRITLDRRALIPRPETETLVEAVRADGPRLVADVGTGSGAIAVALAVNEPGMRVIGTDISAEALAVARLNVEWHGVTDRVELREGDLLAPLTERVDAVAANLPYLRDDAVAEWIGERASLSFEPPVAVVAGPDGLALIRRLVADLPRVLAPGGAAFIECDPPQARALARRHDGEVLRDLAGDDRVVVIRRRD